MRQRRVCIHHPFNQRLNLAAALFLAEQARLHHLGIVKHQHIARLHPIGQIGKHFVGHRRIGQSGQQTAAAAHSGRMLGNQSFGQVKIKIGKLHGFSAVFKKSAIIRTFFFRRPARTAYLLLFSAFCRHTPQSL